MFAGIPVYLKHDEQVFWAPFRIAGTFCSGWSRSWADAACR
jgi:hypothetical protein